MSVSINWANEEKSGLILTFMSPWTWDEYEILSDTIRRSFESVDYAVDLIVDLRDVGDIPADVVSYLRDAYASDTPNLRQYIYVGVPVDFIETLAVADRYYSALGGELQYRCVESLKEAKRLSLWAHLVSRYESQMLI